MTGGPRELPRRRLTATIEFQLADGYAAQEYSACYAEFAPGDLAEVFLTPVYGRACKVGWPLDTMAKDLSVLFSIARRYGAPVAVIRAALSQQSDGAMLGPLGEFLRLHAAEAPLPPDGLETPPSDGGPSDRGQGGAAVAAGAVPPASPSPAATLPAVAPPSGEGGEALAPSCSAEPPGLAASFEGGAP